jgi:aminoglycoside phosphotransferase (APT) family kinase protein
MEAQFTGTRPVDDSLAFNADALQAYLARQLPGFAGPMEIRQFKGGQSNPTYQIITPTRSYVMRSKPGPTGKLLPSAHAIEREYRVMRALAGSTVPVPATHLLCADEAVIGRAFYLMDFVEGRVLWDQSLPGMSPAERAAIYDDMNRVLAALHSVDLAATGLADFGKADGYVERQIVRWSRQYEATVIAPIEEMDRLIDWLPKHLPHSARDERERCLVQGDYRLDNLILDSHEPRVRAVLDWELSTVGHPLADLSYHCMSWHMPPGEMRGITGLDHAALGLPTEADYVRRYCDRTGRADADAVMTDWPFYLAYNFFRFAAIAQGIARRVVDGTAASAQAQQAGANAAPLARLAWRFASGSH